MENATNKIAICLLVIISCVTCACNGEYPTLSSSLPPKTKIFCSYLPQEHENTVKKIVKQWGDALPSWSVTYDCDNYNDTPIVAGTIGRGDVIGTYMPNNDVIMIDIDMIINHDINLETTLSHEIGHSFGLSNDHHHQNDKCIMHLIANTSDQSAQICPETINIIENL
jgi:hypothetical protein